MSEQLYYIQHTEKYAYDYVLWWGKDSKGYTHNLDDAGLYTEEKAKSICALRGEEIAFPKEQVESCIDRAVDIGKLRKLGDGLLRKPREPVKEKKPPASKCQKCGRFFSCPDPYQETCAECERWY